MPRPPFRRISNGKRRRLSVNIASRKTREHALCSTQQALLRTVQNNILCIIFWIKINFTLILFAEAGCRLFPDLNHRFDHYKSKIFRMNAVLASALQLFINADARIADIPFEEERIMMAPSSPRNNQTFDQFTNSELRDLTNFPRPALLIIKKFLQLPRNMYINQTTGEIAGEGEDHAGCRLFFDEEMILFGLGKLAKGLKTTVLVDNVFGGDRSRWSIGFRFFLKHVKEMVFPQLVGFEGIRRFVGQFPAFAACLEKKMEKPRMIRCRDGVVREVAGRLFRNGDFNVVGTFDCRIQRTNIPGTHPGQDGLRRLDAYEIQEAVYSGHKKMHGVKAFTCMLANGLSFMHHPISARR